MTKHFCISLFAIYLLVFGQSGQEARPLEPGQRLEREIAGGEAHTYQIMLQAGQFVRFRLDQRAIDAILILTAPNGKQLVEMNLTRADEEESLSLEAAAAGSYRLTVRGNGAATLRGSYRLEAAAQATATASDRRRLTAEALLVEANELGKQGAKTAPQVIEKLQQVLPLWRELGEPYWTARSLIQIGHAYFDLSQFVKAIEYYEPALQLNREVKNRGGEASTLYYLGLTYNRLSRYQKSVEYFEQALPLNRELKNRKAEGDTLNLLGISSDALGNYEQAIECLEQFLQIAREIKNQRGEGYALINLGITNNRLSRYEKAIENNEQALALAREIKNRLSEANALLSLGDTYGSLGRPEKSVEYYEQALAIYRELKDRRAEGIALGNLGTSYNLQELPKQAIGYLEQGLEIARELKNRGSEGDLLLKLGNTHSSLGRSEKAIENYEKALQIARETKNPESEDSALLALGQAHHSLRRLDEAVSHHEQALLIARERKLPMKETEALTRLATVERDRGNLARARNLIEECLAITESLRVGVVSQENRAGFLSNAQNAYQLYTDLLMRQHQAEPTKGLDALAVETSERQRARSLLDLLSEARADVRQGVDPALLERERSLGRQLNHKAQLLTQANSPEQAAALKQEISQLETDYEWAQAAIRKASPHYTALTQPQPLKLKEIQAQLDASTLLLEYALGAERSYLWAITTDSLSSYELPKEAQITQATQNVLDLLTARGASKRGETPQQRRNRIAQAEARLPAAARALSQTLLGPVASKLGHQRLVIVADGALQYIPFAMLPKPVVRGQGSGVSEKNSAYRPPTTDHRPLIVEHEIVSLPSASALAIQRAELAGRPLAPKMLAIIADPVFDRSDARLTTPVTETNDRAQPPTITLNHERTIEHLAEKSNDKSGRKLVIPRLPYTRQEADQILALTPQTSSFRAVDFQASSATVLNGDLGQYRYVHFATHGLADTEKPWNSSLVLSLVNAEGQPQNGFLRLKDIYNLKLPAELVVLSACQTGIGKEIRGEGMEALTRGFMNAGAARVVVSLWSVNDKATSELMTRFYQKMLKEGQAPAAALRAAQVEMWRQKAWQAPYYWAAFVLQGEWK